MQNVFQSLEPGAFNVVLWLLFLCPPLYLLKTSGSDQFMVGSFLQSKELSTDSNSSSTDGSAPCTSGKFFAPEQIATTSRICLWNATSCFYSFWLSSERRRNPSAKLQLSMELPWENEAYNLVWHLPSHILNNGKNCSWEISSSFRKAGSDSATLSRFTQ